MVIAQLVLAKADLVEFDHANGARVWLSPKQWQARDLLFERVLAAAAAVDAAKYKSRLRVRARKDIQAKALLVPLAKLDFNRVARERPVSEFSAKT